MTFKQLRLKVSYHNYIYLSTNSLTELDFIVVDLGFFCSYTFFYSQLFSLNWKILTSRHFISITLLKSCRQRRITATIFYLLFYPKAIGFIIIQFLKSS